ncbi:hypothetical protein AALO_G00144810 [Alosa alosa]|uniref:Uncharacterized protein n=1 Tax=Alosa alosa TaxID=278164 RepID=A0AAV6GNB9_9TELE|nr:hypothetical protein AALO_G00144810 [Alosa alosa]
MKEKRQAKYTENKLKAIKARNEYLLQLEACDSVFKYYIHDLADFIVSRQTPVGWSIPSAADRAADKQRIMETYNNVFCPPMRFDFQSHMGDTMDQLCAQQPVQVELLQRCQQLQSRLSTLRIENEEVKKTMEATLQTIQDMVTVGTLV